MCTRSGVGVIVAALLVPAIASAQDVDASVPLDASSEAPTARSLFDEGMTALEAGDNALAEARFRASFELDARPSSAWMLAAVLQEAGRPGEAIALYDRILDGELGGYPPDIDEAEIRRLRDAAEGQRAEVTVTATGAEELRIELDGREVGSVRRGAQLSLRVDPGTHTLAGRAGELDAEPVTISVGRGEQRSVHLRLPELEVRPPVAEEPVTPPIAPIVPEVDEGSALPWLLGGTGALVVVAAVVVTILLVSSSGDEYSSGPWNSVDALTAP